MDAAYYFGGPSKRFCKARAGVQIDLNDMSTRLLPHAPRIGVAVRLPEENARFCDALTAVAATL